MALKHFKQGLRLDPEHKEMKHFHKQLRSGHVASPYGLSRLLTYPDFLGNSKRRYRSPILSSPTGMRKLRLNRTKRR